MRIQFYFYQLLFVFSCHQFTGQHTIVAKVIDADTRQPIKEATVTIEGTKINTVTNAAGFFQLSTDTTKYLIIERPGYTLGKIKVPATKNFLVPLKKDGEITIISNEYEKGAVKDGFKIGTWEYYDKPGQLSLKLNYTSGNILFIPKDTSMHVVEINGV